MDDGNFYSPSIIPQARRLPIQSRQRMSKNVFHSNTVVVEMLTDTMRILGSNISPLPAFEIANYSLLLCEPGLVSSDTLCADARLTSD